jgi:hypothetical protein
MDQHFLSEVLNIGVEKIDCIVGGGERCTYKVHTEQAQLLSPAQANAA